jgi:hypothetical protein
VLLTADYPGPKVMMRVGLTKNNLMISEAPRLLQR